MLVLLFVVELYIVVVFEIYTYFFSVPGRELRLSVIKSHCVLGRRVQRRILPHLPVRGIENI